jgi:hypothetical protein
MPSITTSRVTSQPTQVRPIPAAAMVAFGVASTARDPIFAALEQYVRAMRKQEHIECPYAEPTISSLSS